MEYYSLVLIIAVLLSLLGYHFYVHHSKLGKSVNRIPGPVVLPFLGNLLDLHVSSVEIFQTFRKLSKKYYPVYKLWLFSRATIHIRHPDDIEILLKNSNNVNKDFGYKHFRPWLKTGLLTSCEAKWHKRRKMLSPAFHLNILKHYLDTVNEQGENLISDLRELDERRINVVSFCSKHMLNIICESAMGISLNNEVHIKETVKYRRAVHKMTSIMFYRVMRPYVKDWMVPYIPNLYRETQETMADHNGLIDKIVKERRAYHESTNYRDLHEDFECNSNVIHLGKRKRLAMLDLLLAAEEQNLIDDEGIKEEVATFILAGHDATAITMCYTMMLLAENTACQNEARKEVEEIVKEKNGTLDMSDLQRMNYLERCIKESLRLFTTVPSLARYITKDMQLKHCFAPKGSDVVVHVVDLHRDPNYWPEPDKFEPDRFLPERVRERHAFAYLPFSGGIRNCIGQKFAMMTLKCLLSRVLCDFRIEPIDHTKDVKVLMDLVQRPSQPVHMKFIQINKQ